jgi:SAM-dependent methyltransferase
MGPQVSPRDQAEIKRSASEASKIVVKPTQIDRYLHPAANTPFALEYAFHLLGDVRGKTVLDLGCGSGENIVPLLTRGARVLGIDICPDLIAIAQRRLRDADMKASVSVDSAYETGLPDESIDLIFCIALIHHLDIKLVRDEMWRILRPGGVVILKEPIRFSKTCGWLRRLLPAPEDISDFEHPLTHEELDAVTQPFEVEGTRYFRLPFVPLISQILSSKTDSACRASNWSLRHLPALEHYATCVVTRLKKPVKLSILPRYAEPGLSYRNIATSTIEAIRMSFNYRCRDCGKEVGVHSRRRTITERYILPLFLMQPVRCASCFRRDCRLIFTPVHERSHHRDATTGHIHRSAA